MVVGAGRKTGLCCGWLQRSKVEKEAAAICRQGGWMGEGPLESLSQVPLRRDIEGDVDMGLRKSEAQRDCSEEEGEIHVFHIFQR